MSEGRPRGLTMFGKKSVPEEEWRRRSVSSSFPGRQVRALSAQDLVFWLAPYAEAGAHGDVSVRRWMTRSPLLGGGCSSSGRRTAVSLGCYKSRMRLIRCHCHTVRAAAGGLQASRCSAEPSEQSSAPLPAGPSGAERIFYWRLPSPNRKGDAFCKMKLFRGFLIPCPSFSVFLFWFSACWGTMAFQHPLCRGVPVFV